MHTECLPTGGRGGLDHLAFSYNATIFSSYISIDIFSVPFRSKACDALPSATLFETNKVDPYISNTANCTTF